MRVANMDDESDDILSLFQEAWSTWLWNGRTLDGVTTTALKKHQSFFYTRILA